MTWVRVSLPWATFGLRVERGVIVEAAPIARWALGKNQKVVADYYRKRGATFVVLEDSDSEQEGKS